MMDRNKMKGVSILKILISFFLENMKVKHILSSSVHKGFN